MINVMKEIRSWAAGRPYWEQATLDKVLTGDPFSEADHEQLARYLLEDAGLVEGRIPRPSLEVETMQYDSSESSDLGEDLFFDMADEEPFLEEDPRNVRPGGQSRRRLERYLEWRQLRQRISDDWDDE